MSTKLLQSLESLADTLAKKAQDETTDIQDRIKVFKELREFYATLTKGGEGDDKASGKRPVTNFADLRQRIALVSGSNGGEMDDDEPE